MNIGFIGVGGVAQAHLKNLAPMRGVRIRAVCDARPERAQEVASTYGATPHANHRKMLRAESLDACYVCVPPGAHGRIELELAEARMPFFMEKPVHLNFNAARRVIDALERTGTTSCVGYHWRYMKTTRAARRFLKRHTDVRFVEGWWYDGFVDLPWWRRMKMSGGQIVEQTTHVVDTARYLAGEVQTVHAIGCRGAMTDIEGYDIHDASVMTLQFDNGAIGQITTGCISDGHDQLKVGLTVRGRGFSASIDTKGGTLRDRRGPRQLESGQKWSEQVGNGDRAFVRAIRTGDTSKIESDYRNAAQTLAVTLCANRSMQTRRSVQVPRVV